MPEGAGGEVRGRAEAVPTGAVGELHCTATGQVARACADSSDGEGKGEAAGYSESVWEGEGESGRYERVEEV